MITGLFINGIITAEAAGTSGKQYFTSAYGFQNAVYDVNEDDRLDTTFLYPAKGEPSDVIPGLVIIVTITAEAAAVTSYSMSFAGKGALRSSLSSVLLALA